MLSELTRKHRRASDVRKNAFDALGIRNDQKWRYSDDACLHLRNISSAALEDQILRFLFRLGRSENIPDLSDEKTAADQQKILFRILKSVWERNEFQC